MRLRNELRCVHRALRLHIGDGDGREPRDEIGEGRGRKSASKNKYVDSEGAEESGAEDKLSCSEAIGTGLWSSPEPDGRYGSLIPCLYHGDGGKNVA